jgi:3-hydroxyacyl-CoA dehydrogenase
MRPTYGSKCVPESLKLKRKVAEDLDELANSNTIIASNSSSYTINEITEGLSLKHPERFLSLHSCKPVLLRRAQYPTN